MSTSSPETPTPSLSSPQSIKLAGATALGVGGMMGAGLFSLLGLASQHAGNQIATAKQILPIIFEKEKLFTIVEKTLAFFNKHGRPGERFRHC